MNPIYGSILYKYSLQGADGLENLHKYIEHALEGKASGKEYPFIVFDKRTGEYAGSTRFYDIIPAFQFMQLGYTWYGKKFQGTGLNKHCKYLLFEFAFEKAGVERLELRADNDNTRSIAAMKSIGCKVDGILRANMPRPASLPGRRDSIVLSVLKDEWYNEVKPLLKRQIEKVDAGR
jgi:N-acetyltransferase